MPEDPNTSRPKTRRPRRFVVRDGDDHRATEKIEQFLSGPRSTARARPRRPSVGDLAQASPLDTRSDFAAALERETARTERYGRPATILAVAFAVSPGPTDPTAPSSAGPLERQIDRLAGPIGFTLRREARDVDRIARVAPNRFHVLLPETTEDDARRYVERARQACEVWFTGAALPVELRIESASSGSGRSLREALAAVEDRLSA